MKKYIKPAIEEIKIGVQYPINSSDNLTVGDDNSGIGTGEAAPGRKNKDYDDEDDFGDGW